MSHKRNADAQKTPKDEQRTPPSLFKVLDDRFHFDVDAASTWKNKLCKFSFNKFEADALGSDWSMAGDVFFCNPPYSHGMVEQFLIKGYQESQKGAIVVFLISSDVSPAYYDWCMLAAEWIRIKGRVDFNHEDGTPIKGSAMFGSMAIVFDHKRWIAQGKQTIVTQVEWK